MRPVLTEPARILADGVQLSHFGGGPCFRCHQRRTLWRGQKLGCEAEREPLTGRGWLPEVGGLRTGRAEGWAEREQAVVFGAGAPSASFPEWAFGPCGPCSCPLCAWTQTEELAVFQLKDRWPLVA